MAGAHHGAEELGARLDGADHWLHHKPEHAFTVWFSDRITRLFRIVDAADPATTFGATRGVGAFKTALTLLGVIASNAVSLPMRRLDDDETKRIRIQLEAAGLL